MINTAVYSVLSSAFPTTREKILGYAETASGVGLMLGPIIGGTLNTLLNYLSAYLIFTAMLTINGIITFIFMPNSLNESPEITEKEFDAIK